MRPAGPHFLAKGKNLAKIFFEFGAGNERAFAALAVRHTETAQRFQGMTRGHAADAHAFGNFLFGGNGLAYLQSAGANLLQQTLLNLVVERNYAFTIEGELAHGPLHLYRRLDIYSRWQRLSSGFCT